MSVSFTPPPYLLVFSPLPTPRPLQYDPPDCMRRSHEDNGIVAMGGSYCLAMVGAGEDCLALFAGKGIVFGVSFASCSKNN